MVNIMNRLELMNNLYKMKDGEVKNLCFGNSFSKITIIKGDLHLENGNNWGYEGEVFIEMPGEDTPGRWFTNAVSASDYFSDEQIKKIKW